MKKLKTSLELIADECSEQITKHGYDEKHDDDHFSFELTNAAICYASQACSWGLAMWQDRIPNRWPFQASSWKPSPQIIGHKCPIISKEDSIKMLVKAAALIAKEIDRLQRDKKSK